MRGRGIPAKEVLWLTAKGPAAAEAAAWLTLELVMLLLYLMLGPAPITCCSTPRANRSLLPRPAPCVTIAAFTNWSFVDLRISPKKLIDIIHLS